MIVNDPESQSPITMLLIQLEVRPCVWYLEYCNHLVPNQCSFGNEKVCECTDFFRVSSKHCRPTENRSSINHLLIVCKLISSISVVRGITCGNRSYQIIPQKYLRGCPSTLRNNFIYSSTISKVLGQSLGLNIGINLGSLWDSSMYCWCYIVGPWRAQHLHVCTCPKSFWSAWYNKSCIVGSTQLLLTLQPQDWTIPQ